MKFVQILKIITAIAERILFWKKAQQDTTMQKEHKHEK